MTTPRVTLALQKLALWRIVLSVLRRSTDSVLEHLEEEVERDGSSVSSDRDGEVDIALVLDSFADEPEREQPDEAAGNDFDGRDPPFPRGPLIPGESLEVGDEPGESGEGEGPRDLLHIRSSMG